MNPAIRYPAVRDLAPKARRRIPHFAWEYLDSGDGDERAVAVNLSELGRVVLTPQFMKGRIDPDLSTELFGVRYRMPIGVSPVGLNGLIWPDADVHLAKMASNRQIPFVASTVGTGLLEDLGAVSAGMGWFQLYPPGDTAVRDDLLDRAAASGFTTLVVTVDIPARSRRERQIKARVSVPPRITPRLVAQAMVRPAWGVDVLRNGLPRFKTLEKYADAATMKDTAAFISSTLVGALSWEYLEEIRERWDGPLVVKGILDPGDATRCVDSGVDGIVVSNHGGRQFDGAPAAILALPPVLEAVDNRLPVMFDSGIRTGLDIARALALGADFVFAGRAFMYGLGALGASGPDHVASIFKAELATVMHQLGCQDLAELRHRDARFEG